MVGAPYDDITIGAQDRTDQGSVYVFTRPPGGTWAAATHAKLTASDGASGDALGTAVAIEGDTVVAVAPGHDVFRDYIRADAGSAYVFTKPAGGWVDGTETARLLASDGEGQPAPDNFGSSIAVSVDTVVVGVPGAGGVSAEPGSVYVFTKPAGGWASSLTEAAKLNVSGTQYFGSSVAVEGDTLVAGALDHNGTNAYQGSVYVFTRLLPGGWADATRAKLTASDGGSNDNLGSSVDIEGDTIVAGARYGGNASDFGAVYVFTKPAGGWVDATPHSAKLTATLQLSSGLGFSVAISGNTIVAGAPDVDAYPHQYTGAAFVFTKPDGSPWVNVNDASELSLQPIMLTSSPQVNSSFFGNGVALSGGTVFVGHPGADGVSPTYAVGSVYVFGSDDVTPDLVVSELSAPPASVIQGGSFTVTDTTANTGAGGAGPSTTRYYLSTDSTITAADTLLTGTRAVLGLDAGSDDADSVTVTVPVSLTVGTYYLGACADDQAAVTESDETNNCQAATSSTVEVTAALPDLVVTSVGAPPASAVQGGNVAATDTTTNQGPVTAGASTTRYYLSTDDTITGGDTLLTGTRAVASLGAGVGSSGGATVTVPPSLATGQYYLGACADDVGDVTESSEANNCLAALGTVQVVAAIPDLAVQKTLSSPPTAVATGGSFGLNETTLNQGTATAGTSTTRYYLSVDSTITSGDLLLTGVRSVPSLAPGASSTKNTTVTVPLSVAPSTYYLGACADDLGVVSESSETNNCTAATKTVQVLLPAPTVSSFTPQSGKVGAAVTIYGTNFTGATAVTFGGTKAAFSVTNGGQIAATVPKGAKTGPIAVTTPSGTGKSATNFTVTK